MNPHTLTRFREAAFITKVASSTLSRLLASAKFFATNNHAQRHHERHEWNKWSCASTSIVAGSSQCRWSRLLLQHNYESNTMDQTRGPYDPGRGEPLHTSQYRFSTDCCSVPSRTSHGRSIPLKGGESIGITPNRSRVPGRCQISTRKRLPQTLR